MFKISQVLKLKNQSSSSEFNAVNSPLPESLNPEGSMLYLRTKLCFSPEEASGLFHSYPLSHLLGAQDVYHKGKSLSFSSDLNPMSGPPQLLFYLPTDDANSLNFFSSVPITADPLPFSQT